MSHGHIFHSTKFLIAIIWNYGIKLNLIEGEIHKLPLSMPKIHIQTYVWNNLKIYANTYMTVVVSGLLKKHVHK